MILVGEIRDVETARVAVQSALTGHFVVSSLHATDAVSALHRFLDMGSSHSSSLRRCSPSSASDSCAGSARRARPATTRPPKRWRSTKTAGATEGRLLSGTGCNFCSDTGYQDRIGVYELLEMTPEIRRLIVGWATQEELRSLAQKQGMRTLRTEAINLVAEDVTTVAEVIRSMYTL